MPRISQKKKLLFLILGLTFTAGARVATLLTANNNNNVLADISHQCRDSKPEDCSKDLSDKEIRRIDRRHKDLEKKISDECSRQLKDFRKRHARSEDSCEDDRKKRCSRSFSRSPSCRKICRSCMRPQSPEICVPCIIEPEEPEFPCISPEDKLESSVTVINISPCCDNKDDKDGCKRCQSKKSKSKDNGRATVEITESCKIDRERKIQTVLDYPDIESFLQKSGCNLERLGNCSQKKQDCGCQKPSNDDHCKDPCKEERHQCHEPLPDIKTVPMTRPRNKKKLAQKKPLGVINGEPRKQQE